MRNVCKVLVGALWKFILIICQCHFFKWRKPFLYNVSPLIPVFSLLSTVEVFLGLQVLHRPHIPWINFSYMHTFAIFFFILSQFSYGFGLSTWSKNTSCLLQFVIYFDHEKFTYFKSYWVRSVLCVSCKTKGKIYELQSSPWRCFQACVTHIIGFENFNGERKIIFQ